MSSVLVVEDEPKVASFIQRGLVAEGIYCDIAYDGERALQMASEKNYDVITVDLMLPGQDGYSVIESLRKDQHSAGILILSARDMLEDKLRGFRIGSDDYLAKPFAFEELLARINVLAMRRSAWKPVPVAYADLVIDRSLRNVRRGTRQVELTGTEFKLLDFLLVNAEKACSRVEIAAGVWNEHFDRETNIVDVYLMYLRKKIDGENETPLIHTVRGVGYMLGLPKPPKVVAE